MKPSASLQRCSCIRLRPLRRLTTRAHPTASRLVPASIVADALTFNRISCSIIQKERENPDDVDDIVDNVVDDVPTANQSMVANTVPWPFIPRPIHRPLRHLPFKFGADIQYFLVFQSLRNDAGAGTSPSTTRATITFLTTVSIF